LNRLIHKQLQEQLPPIEYERFIKHLKYSDESSRDDYAVFETINIYIANWIKTRYSELLLNILERITKFKPKLEIVVRDKKIEKILKTESDKSQKSTLLNPAFTFENFVVGNLNQFAFSASKSVAESLGKIYNPLFIYGGVGLGKTHLLHAIGNHNINKKRSVIFTTIEQFMNDFTYNIKNHTMERFKEKYRTCDLLLIDDVQFLSGKIQTQEEFFHTFNELHSKKKQIVLTSDKHPSQIIGLEDRLRSRFEWGLITDIQKPELNTKISIIRKKCELDGIKLRNDVINFIATNMDSNIREIEGVIIKLNAYASLMNQEIDLNFAKSILKEHIKEQNEEITLDDVVEIVSKELNIKPSEIQSKSKSKQIANARRIIIYLARVITPNSMPALAHFFGMRDHSSVSHTMKRVKNEIENDSDYSNFVENLKTKILKKRVG